MIHCLIATSDNKVISVTARKSDDISAGIIHKLFDVELEDPNRFRFVHKVIDCDLDKLYELLYYYENYNDQKEIDFLKICIDYLRINPQLKSIKISFYND